MTAYIIPLRAKLSKGVMPAAAPRVATEDSPHCFQPAQYQSIFFNRLISILRAGGVKSAKSMRVQQTKWPVVWRKCLLIDPNGFKQDKAGKIEK